MNNKTKRRPLIGVTGPDEGGDAAWWFTRMNILLAGGVPKRITPTKDDAVDELDGVVLGGGADVGEWVFERGGTMDEMREVFRHRTGLFRRIFFMAVHGIRLLGSYNVPQRFTHDKARDQLETVLLKQVFERRLPVLGICRGAQLLNVFCGGTLHRDLKSFYQETRQIRTVLPRKEIFLESKSLLSNILSTGRCRVNALHWQAIDRPGKQLSIVARERNSVVQAIEHTDHPFAIGVQWHPEFLLPHKRQRRLFSALVQTARSHL